MPLEITPEDIEALARVAQSEVGGFRGRGYSDWEEAVKAVVDTVLNRAVSGVYPSSISDVINQKNQFSAVSGAKGAVGSWTKLPVAPSALSDVVKAHLTARAAEAPSVIGGNLNFLNPYTSSPGPMKQWGNFVRDNPLATFGSDRAKFIHYHGTAPGYQQAFARPKLSMEAAQLLGYANPETAAARSLLPESITGPAPRPKSPEAYASLKPGASYTPYLPKPVDRKTADPTAMAYMPAVDALPSRAFDAVMTRVPAPTAVQDNPSLALRPVVPSLGPIPPLPVGSRYSETNYVSTMKPTNPWEPSIPDGPREAQQLVRAALSGDAAAIGKAGSALQMWVAGDKDTRASIVTDYFGKVGQTTPYGQQVAERLRANPDLGNALPNKLGWFTTNFGNIIKDTLKTAYPAPVDYTSIYRPNAPSKAPQPVQVASFNPIFASAGSGSGASATMAIKPVVSEPSRATGMSEYRPMTAAKAAATAVDPRAATIAQYRPMTPVTAASKPAPAPKPVVVQQQIVPPPATYDYSQFYKSNAPASAPAEKSTSTGKTLTIAKDTSGAKAQPKQTAQSVATAPRTLTPVKPVTAITVAPAAATLPRQVQNISQYRPMTPVVQQRSTPLGTPLSSSSQSAMVQGANSSGSASNYYRSQGVSVNQAGQVVSGSLPNQLRYPGT